MIDFMVISTRSTKRGVIEIYPKFIIKKSSDLMIRGGDFYAIWIEERGLWSTDEQDALQLIDRELDRYAEENRRRFDSDIKVLHMWDAESGMIDSWHKYCQKQMRDSFHMLDEKLIFFKTIRQQHKQQRRRLKKNLIIRGIRGRFSHKPHTIPIKRIPEKTASIYANQPYEIQYDDHDCRCRHNLQQQHHIFLIRNSILSNQNYQ